MLDRVPTMVPEEEKGAANKDLKGAASCEGSTKVMKAWKAEVGRTRELLKQATPDDVEEEEERGGGRGEFDRLWKLGWCL